MNAGMNLREALAEARRLGCTVAAINGTGEFSVSHPSWRHHVKLNGRKKSAPRILTTRLLGLTRPQAPGPPAPVVTMICVQPIGDPSVFVVRRGPDYWTGTEWDPNSRQARVYWARQEARAVRRRLAAASMGSETRPCESDPC
jgi:hypothetical protein